jgi:hypothetical protein
MAHLAAERDLGRIDERTFVPDGSSNLPDLIEFALEENLEDDLLDYLERVWGLTEEQLASVRESLLDHAPVP